MENEIKNSYNKFICFNDLKLIDILEKEYSEKSYLWCGVMVELIYKLNSYLEYQEMTNKEKCFFENINKEQLENICDKLVDNGCLSNYILELLDNEL